MMRWSTGEGERLFAIGDVHGRHDLLARMFGTIQTVISDRAARKNRVILLGDYINRGPASAEVVTLLTRPPGIDAEWIMLRGNHEQMLLDAFDGVSGAASAFLRYGGRATLASYGINVPLGADDRRAQHLVDELRKVMPGTHMEFLRSLPLSVRIGDYFFCHAGIRPGIPLTQQSKSDLLYIRDEFLDSDACHGACIVHGHTPSQEVKILKQRIGTDTGAYATDRLGGVLLEGGEQSPLYDDGALHYKAATAFGHGA